ncbi:hypothetical protein N9164_13775 [Draconibacterium sp.]|nr:hypothetical protein [Draconibacterium sp.]
MTKRSTILSMPLFIFFWFAADLGIAFIYLIDHLLDAPLGIHFRNLFDMNKEQNLPTWYSTIQLFVVGTFFLLAAASFREKLTTAAGMLSIMGLIFLVLSLDESVGIHEKLGELTDVFLSGGDRANTVFVHTGIWMFVMAIPFLLALLYLVFLMSRYIKDRQFVRLSLIGIVVFLGSAGGLEIIGNFLPDELIPFQVAAEETGEMVGVTLILWAVYGLLARSGVYVQGIGKPSAACSSG